MRLEVSIWQYSNYSYSLRCKVNLIFIIPTEPSVLILISVTLRTSLWDSNGLAFGLGVLRCLKNFIPTRGEDETIYG